MVPMGDLEAKILEMEGELACATLVLEQKPRGSVHNADGMFYETSECSGIVEPIEQTLCQS